MIKFLQSVSTIHSLIGSFHLHKRCYYFGKQFVGKIFLTSQEFLSRPDVC